METQHSLEVLGSFCSCLFMRAADRMVYEVVCFRHSHNHFRPKDCLGRRQLAGSEVSRRPAKQSYHAFEYFGVDCCEMYVRQCGGGGNIDSTGCWEYK
jgi:hypothetical protein